MALPNVNIQLDNGALGGISASADGVVALVLTGTATTELALSVPTTIFSLSDLQALGLTAVNNPHAYKHISEFYQEYKGASNGQEIAELHFMLVPDTLTLTQAADATQANGAAKLLEHAKGRVRLLGITRKPASGYTPVLTDGVDADVLTAVQKAHELCEGYAAKQNPLRCLVEGIGFKIAAVAALKDLRTMAYNRAGVVLGSTDDDSTGSVGLVLGRAAALPVQRNIGRVKDGPLSITAGYVGDKAVEDLTGLSAIHDKGYIIIRTFPNKDGYFFNDDPMAAPQTDDYCMLARGRVIDKAHRITYATYVEEINDELTTDDAGKISIGTAKYLETRVRQAIEQNMVGEIDRVTVFVGPDQNVLSQNGTKISEKVRPKGYNKDIDVLLGFDNPALQ